MTKSELIEAMALRQIHLAHHDVELGVKEILEYVSQSLATGERIEIRGFGSFSLHFRPPRVGRNPKTGDSVALPGKFPGLDQLGMERLEVRDGSSAIGRSLLELELRRTTGATVLAVQRAGVVHPNPAADFRLERSDVLWVLGEPSAIDRVLELVDPHVPVA